MFMRAGLLIVPLIAFHVALAQSGRDDFVLDSSNPYVYLQFDHIGPRKPIQHGEPSTGLWLRIVNNCRVPVIVGTFGITTGDVGVGVIDEVIREDRGGVRVEAEGAAIPTVPVGSDSAPEKPKATKPMSVPEGYSAEVHSATRIPPGESLLFSVPINHVGSDWFMRVRFTLAVSGAQVGNVPYSYVDFYESQIPLKSRSPKESVPSAVSDHPEEQSVLHESQHAAAANGWRQ
jgi:hypothetical protein